MLDCRIFSANGTLLRKNAEVYTNGLNFIVKSFLASTMFYPLVAFGIIREGETRQFECISDEAFVFCAGCDTYVGEFGASRQCAVYAIQSQSRPYECSFEGRFENDWIPILPSAIPFALRLRICDSFGGIFASQ